MSMEFATIFEKRGKLLKSEPELGSESVSRGKLLKSEPELKQKLKTKPDGDVVERDFSKYDDSIHPYMYMNMNGDVVYKNEAWKKTEAAIEDYKKRSRGLSAYDAIPSPAIPPSVLSLSGGVVPLPIKDNNRPTLIALSNLALRDYNQRTQGPTFVFHQLVKCCIRFSARMGYYITFQAKAQEEEDPTTFQAQVWEGREEPPEVKECKIKKI